MSRGYLYRVIAITLAFLVLGVSLLLPLAGALRENQVWLWVAIGLLSSAYIGCLVWSLLDYRKKQKRGKEEEDR